MLLVEPNYREGGRCPAARSSRTTARARARARGGRPPRRSAWTGRWDLLLAVDWVRTEGVPPLVAYLYDGGVLGEDELRAIRLQEEELLSWRLVEREEIAAHLPGSLGRRVLAALDVLADGSGTAELEDGRRVH